MSYNSVITFISEYVNLVMGHIDTFDFFFFLIFEDGDLIGNFGRELSIWALSVNFSLLDIKPNIAI